jgi:aryl-alcohol dehydrogenase-like predicted oxidoreductase
MSAIATYDLRPGTPISRVIRGGWQLAGGHGAVDREAAVDDLVAAFEAGIFTFDCADIYTGVEELYGAVRTRIADRHGRAAAARMRVHTKLVPDLSILGRIRRADVETIVDTSLARLRVERLDLVQYHWWDYAQPMWLEALGWLDDLRRAGKVGQIGGTNFDTPHTAEIVAAGVPLVSMQVQYSVLDARPENGLVDLCARHDVALLCYGSVAGGFLGDRWLGAAEPTGQAENRSLTKYKLIIDDFGGWDLFQELLRALRGVAGRHGTDIATVASAWVLDRRQVGAVIVGARNRAHLAANLAIAGLALTDGDRAEIAAVTDRRQGPEGDTFTLERDRNGRHGSIMKYNLNAEAP